LEYQNQEGGDIQLLVKRVSEGISVSSRKGKKERRLKNRFWRGSMGSEENIPFSSKGKMGGERLSWKKSLVLKEEI